MLCRNDEILQNGEAPQDTEGLTPNSLAIFFFFSLFESVG